MNGVVYVGNGTNRRISRVTQRRHNAADDQESDARGPGRKKNSVAIPTSAELKP